MIHGALLRGVWTGRRFHYPPCGFYSVIVDMVWERRVSRDVFLGRTTSLPPIDAARAPGFPRYGVAATRLRRTKGRCELRAVSDPLIYYGD